MSGIVIYVFCRFLAAINLPMPLLWRLNCFSVMYMFHMITFRPLLTYVWCYTRVCDSHIIQTG